MYDDDVCCYAMAQPLILRTLMQRVVLFPSPPFSDLPTLAHAIEAASCHPQHILTFCPYMNTTFAGKITKLRVCLFVNVHSINLGRLLFGENCDYCQLGGISN